MIDNPYTTKAKEIVAGIERPHMATDRLPDEMFREYKVRKVAVALAEVVVAENERCARVLCEHCASGDVPMNYGEPFTCAHKHVEQGRFPSYSPCKAATIRESKPC